MANAKRASMREGPLAALFRKTEEDEGAARGAASAPQRAAAAAPTPSQPVAPARERPAAPGAERLDAGAVRGRRRLRAHRRGAPAPRLLLGDPRERAWTGPTPDAP